MLLQSRGWNYGKFKILQSSLFLPRFSCFSGMNVPQDAANLWSISRALKKLIMTIFDIFLVVKEKYVFGDPYSDFLC